MIKVMGKVEKTICVAFSGGADSAFAVDFLLRGNRDVLALYFNHGTAHGKEAENFVVEFCRERKVPLVVGGINSNPPKGMSKEAFWREQRYSFFESPLSGAKYRLGDFDYSRYSNCRVVTSHHLDDVVETWIFSSLNGSPKIIPYERGKYVRPFLLNKKSEIMEYMERNNVSFVNDPSNFDTSYRRNYVRHELMPHALEVNPGLYKTIKKKIVGEYSKKKDSNEKRLTPSHL